MTEMSKENWGAGDPYELYVGRWSRNVAMEFLEWISVPAKAGWADVGCGTGVVTRMAARIVGERGAVAGLDFNSAMIEVA